MRYAIFSDIHANLEALEAVLAKIDEIREKEPIDQIWFLGDLVGYGPNPNECITKLRERTDVIIAGNHDWAAVGKIDLEDFSAAARISAEWTAEQLTEEHRAFLSDLPERLQIGEVTLVHGSPFGPLWEYLTSEVLAERSFQHFYTTYCFVGHTHVPVIFIQPDTIATEPTHPLTETVEQADEEENHNHTQEHEEEATEIVAVRPPTQPLTLPNTPLESAISAYRDPASGQAVTEEAAKVIIEQKLTATEATGEVAASTEEEQPSTSVAMLDEQDAEETSITEDEQGNIAPEEEPSALSPVDQVSEVFVEEASEEKRENETEAETDEHLNNEIEELLTLLGLSQSMIQVTNEMLTPPEGRWECPEGYRAIINPGGVGQPRDGDPRAAFMIYDTEKGFEFYRVEYAIEKTQEKIIKAGLPQYLAVRLAYGR